MRGVKKFKYYAEGLVPQTNKNYLRHKPIKHFVFTTFWYKAWMVDETTYWTLSWGFGFLRPLWTCAGSSSECSQIELAPLLARVCTIWDKRIYWAAILRKAAEIVNVRLSNLTCSKDGGQPLCRRCLTMEMCRPRLRCTEQHSSQIRTPRFILLQPGSENTVTGRTSEKNLK